MTSYENRIYSTVATVLRAQFDPISVYSEYVASPAVFPSVSILETDNSSASQVLDGVTTHVNLSYQIDVYSNKSSGKKAECKEIAWAIDELMQRLGFRRDSLAPTQNYLDSTIYRMTGRYTRLVAVGYDGRIEGE